MHASSINYSGRRTKKGVILDDMLKKQSIRVGKFIKKAMQTRGGGSALPGLVVEKLHPNFLKSTLSELPYGVVLISGTNGKTTTTKIVVQLLRSQGLNVFTNPSGSNFTRGIVASLLSHVDKNGRLNADIAVLELDEAYAVHFIKQVTPTNTLVLNVLRDQLDRFGEIDHTAKLLETVVSATTKGVVLNSDDELVRSLFVKASPEIDIKYYGVDDNLLSLFPSDSKLKKADLDRAIPEDTPANDVTLTSLKRAKAVFKIDDKQQPPIEMQLDGIYNALNAAAALALVRQVLGRKADTALLLGELAKVKPAFGRGEVIDIDGTPLEIVLVKNPSGFRLSLKSYEKTPVATMIAINDLYADGRDMSWLWDVGFEDFLKTGVSFVSGVRAYDMALRLQYDEVEVGRIVPDLTEALAAFLSESKAPKRIYCTYTAMLKLRKELAKKYQLEAIE